MNELWNTSSAVVVTETAGLARMDNRCRSMNSMPVLGAAMGMMLMLLLGLGALAAVAILRTDWMAVVAPVAEYWEMLTHGGGSMFATGP